MIVASAWRGKRYAVLGLARSGAATVRALLASGAHVTAWDADEARREALADEVQALSDDLDSVDLSLRDIHTIDLSTFDALVVSPGVPLNMHPIAAAARAAGVPIIGDIELFAGARAGLPPHKVVGITGTNGKSTTTALVYHILQTAGVWSLMGGNIGLPILAQDPLPEGGVYVLELSSYQIDLTQSLDCNVAVLLNVTPDHLDRYENFSDYAASKARLFAMQSTDHHAVIAGDDDETRQIAAAEWLRRPHDPARSRVHAADVDGQEGWPALQGSHNAQNAVAAAAACRALGIGEGEIACGLETFAGLAHRMEHIAEWNGIAFVNDSKATNPESAAPALAAFPRVHWIVGGRAKGDDLGACAPHFDHVVAAYTIGEAGLRFAEVLRGRVPAVVEAGTLDTAVRAAAAAARPGDTVLLSPACASFDQFRDYEERGAAFRAAVEGLA